MHNQYKIKELVQIAQPILASDLPQLHVIGRQFNLHVFVKEHYKTFSYYLAI